MIKRLQPQTLKYLVNIYNKIWEEGKIPKTWKHSKISSLLKKGKDVKSFNSVALTNILCKIFESMTNKKLVWYLVKEDKINERQFGFRKQRSTIDAISKILDGFRRKEKTQKSSSILRKYGI